MRKVPPRKMSYFYYYRPETKLWKGNVFTSVCQEFCPQGGEVYTPARKTGKRPRADIPLGRPPWQADTPLGRHTSLGRHPFGQTPLWADTSLGRHWHQTATAEDGTHPTGMHSCFSNKSKTNPQMSFIRSAKLKSMGHPNITYQQRSLICCPII